MNAIKLIATDVDGTLVKESSSEMYPEIFEEIKRLTDKGIRFCIASGRQYESVAKLFDPVRDRLCFIAENGAYVRKGDEELDTIWMDRKQVEEIVYELRELEGVEIVAATPVEGSVMESKNQEFIDLIFKGYKNKGIIVDDILKADIPYVKIAAYKKTSILAEGEILIPRWQGLCKCCLAGREWVDFMDAKVDKGNALKLLMDCFGYTKDEVMCFGDNENDMGMLRVASNSYAVENAKENVRTCARFVCPSYEEKGVLQILKGL